jgi:uncharacterized protein (DUF2141 family)
MTKSAFGMHGFQRLALAWTVAALVAASLMVSPARAQAMPGQASGTLVIHVQNVSPKGGILRLGVYDEAGYPQTDSKPVASADVTAQPGLTTITLNNIPPGAYAIQAYQDTNSNDKMDTSWFGIPQEPFGFSRDARPRFSKPGFAAVKFDLGPGINTQTLRLQDSISLIANK